MRSPRLTALEEQEFERAKERGFVHVINRRPNLSNAWWDYCWTERRPYLKTWLGKKYCGYEIHLDPARRRFPESAQRDFVSEIEQELLEHREVHARAVTYSCGPDIAAVDGFSRGRASVLVKRALDFANTRGVERMSTLLGSEMGAGDQNGAVPAEARQPRQYVRVFTGGGRHLIQTNLSDPDRFLEVLAYEITGAEVDFEQLLPLTCQLWARLKGYKAEGVLEERVLTAGEPSVDGYTLLTSP